MKNVRLEIAILGLITLAACNPVVRYPTPLDHPAVQTAARHLEAEYRIQVGDQLDIKFYYNSELNEQVIVRPDGRISLQLVHEVMAAGTTPAELQKRLSQSYAAELRNPEVTVIVRSFAGRSVYVDGEVNRPGIFNFITPITVLQSIAQAGGMKDSGYAAEVVVIRRGLDNKPLVIPVDLHKAIDGTDLRQDIVLKAFDVVYVPKSHIANVNVWVDQYVRKNIPIYFGLSYELAP